MALVIGGIDCTELTGSPVETLEAGKFSATMRIKCPWSDRETVMNGLISTPGFVYPHQTRSAYCFSASAKQGKPGLKIDEITLAENVDVAEYEWAEIAARFGTPDFVTPEPLGPASIMMTETEEPSVIAISLDSSKYQWVAGGSGVKLKPGEAPFKQVFMSEYVITHHDIANSAIGTTYTVHTAVEAMVGKVNAQVELARSLIAKSFAVQTLLTKPVLRQTQGTTSTFTYRFGYNDEGWNKFWRGDTQAWESMFLLGTSTEVLNFPTVDMGALFDA